MANSILMPPILEFNYPSFDMEGDEVIFIGKLSINNNLTQVDHIQVRLLQQDDGKNGLNTTLFPKGIYFIKNSSTDIFYIKLKLFLKGTTIFSNSTDTYIPSFYRMQVRLGYKDETQEDKMYQEAWGQTPPENWLESNGDLFSEWSNTSIIKTTFAPNVTVIGLNEKEVNTLNNPYALFNGTYVTNDTTENIQAYKFELLDSNGIEVETQELNYVRDYVSPSITYQIKSYIKKETTYFLKLTTESVFGFKKTVLYELIFSGEEVPFPLICETSSDNKNACNIIKIAYDKTIFETVDKILIKRLSISNKYSSYDDVYQIQNVKSTMKDIYFKDYLINSEEVYIYYLQLVYTDGSYSSLSAPLPIKTSYDLTYLLGEDNKQIIIYSPQISGINIVQKDSYSETLGSQFPYFQRIGPIDYKSFSLSGNITFLSTMSNEENNIKKETVEDIYSIDAPEEIQEILKQNYGDNVGANYSTSIDYFMEKEYREKLIKFLSDGNVKVIKSPTERLMFIRLSQINVTPKQELTRAIYDFSANAIEVFNEKNIDYSKYIFGDNYEL